MKPKAIQVGVVVTVLNEVETVQELLQALAKQSILPVSCTITDGGSSDGTYLNLARLAKLPWPFDLKIAQIQGNRSLGRNHAIRLTNTEWLAITDAGCIPDKDWLYELITQQHHVNAGVVAGYYHGLAKTSLEQAILPYALVMPDRVDPNNFLPATRSMLLHKSVWQILGGFDEKLSDNEDYAFAKKLESIDITQLNKQLKVNQKKGFDLVLSFTDQAVVSWRPPSNLTQFAKMIFRFARGDVTAGIFRPKVGLIFARYLLGLILLSLVVAYKSLTLLAVVFGLLMLYLFWSVAKNYRYAPHAWYYLPVLQVISDVVILWGSLLGLRGFSLNKNAIT